MSMVLERTIFWIVALPSQHRPSLHLFLFFFLDLGCLQFFARRRLDHEFGSSRGCPAHSEPYMPKGIFGRIEIRVRLGRDSSMIRTSDEAIPDLLTHSTTNDWVCGWVWGSCVASLLRLHSPFAIPMIGLLEWTMSPRFIPSKLWRWMRGRGKVVVLHAFLCFALVVQFFILFI